MSFSVKISNDARNPFGQAYNSLLTWEKYALVAEVAKEDPKMTISLFERRTRFSQKMHPVNFKQKIRDIIVEFKPEVFSYELFMHNDDVPLYLEKKALEFQAEQEKRDLDKQAA